MTERLAWTWLVAAGLAAAGCSGDDAAADARDAADVAPDDGGADRVDAAPEGCPAEPNPPIPETRMRHLRMTAPEAMTGTLFYNLLNDLLDAESFVWLTRFTGVGTGTITMRTGSGWGVEGTDCGYEFLEAEYPTATIEVSETGLDFDLVGDPIPVVPVALWASGTSYPSPPLTVLPLRELRIGGTFATDYLGIGTYDPVAEAWTDGGHLAAKIAVADAMDAPIPSLGVSLCGLLSGDTGTPGDFTDDCSRPRPWPIEPDTSVGGEDAYTMTGTFAGSAVRIAP